MNRVFPKPGDLIQVTRSEWYALKDGEWLRVCEKPGWMKAGEEVQVAPRQQVSCRRNHALLRCLLLLEANNVSGAVRSSGSSNSGQGLSALVSTSGGPFKTVPIEELEGLEHGGSGIDVFWCWVDYPRAGGGMERPVTVAIWRCELLVDQHHRLCQQFVNGGER